MDNIPVKDNYEKFVDFMNYVFNKYADKIDWDHLADEVIQLIAIASTNRRFLRAAILPPERFS